MELVFEKVLSVENLFLSEKLERKIVFEISNFL